MQGQGSTGGRGEANPGRQVRGEAERRHLAEKRGEEKAREKTNTTGIDSLYVCVDKIKGLAHLPCWGGGRAIEA